MKPLNVTLSIIAGLVGGFVEQYVFAPTSAHAQSELGALKTVEAGSFRLVNPAGHLAGTLSIAANGDGVITMFDVNGKPIFTSQEKAIVKPAVAR